MIAKGCDMRMMFLVLLMMLGATTAQAAEMCPGGQLAVMRVSKILPTGSMAGFRAAARDHANWYRAKGLPVTQFVAPVMVYNPKAKAQVASDREVMTVRLGSAAMPRGKSDAGWAAFVAKYKANATIVRETRTCFPKDV
jgi:hypothetical protein